MLLSHREGQDTGNSCLGDRETRPWRGIFETIRKGGEDIRDDMLRMPVETVFHARFLLINWIFPTPPQRGLAGEFSCQSLPVPACSMPSPAPGQIHSLYLSQKLSQPHPYPYPTKIQMVHTRRSLFLRRRREMRCFVLVWQMRWQEEMRQKEGDEAGDRSFSQHRDSYLENREG